MFADKDASSVISTLKFWPKLYNRLSLDEDKKVRELTQQLMGSYSRVCGKEISPFIKQLLPTWIISQSDLYLVAANIAKQSFIETFPDSTKQEKAYLLCWRSIYDIISVNLLKAPIEIKVEKANYTPKEETYIQDVVVNIRTIITLIRYLKNNDEATQDLATLLKSKNFWSHFKQNVVLIQTIYIQLGTELLDYFSDTVTTSTFIASNICECFRMVNVYHLHLIGRIWTSIVKCCDKMGNIVWKYVSFKTVFLPKFLELLTCAANGNISQIYSLMLPFFCHLPIAIDTPDATPIFTQILTAMVIGCHCQRVMNNELESNSTMRMIFECSTYVMIVAGGKNNTTLLTNVLQLLMDLAENYFTDIRLKKTTKSISDFASCVIKPLVNKGTVAIATFTDTILTWIEKHHTSTVFCENLTSLLLEFDKQTGEEMANFRASLMAKIGTNLREKIIDRHDQCLIPYFYASFSLDELTQASDSGILDLCPLLMREYNPEVTRIVSRGLATMFRGKPVFDEFLSKLSTEQSVVFFTRFYPDVLVELIGQSYRNVAVSISGSALTSWGNSLQRSIEQLVSTDGRGDLPVLLSLESMASLCLQSVELHGTDHIATLLARASDTIDNVMSRSVSADSAERLIVLMLSCISPQLRAHVTPPATLVRNLLKLVLYSNGDGPIPSCHGDACRPIVACLPTCGTQLSIDLINDSMLPSACNDTAFSSQVVKAIVDSAITDNDRHASLIGHIESVLLANLSAIETAITSQLPYSSVVAHSSKLDLVATGVHNIVVLQPLASSVDCLQSVAILVDSVLTNAFSSCHNSNRLLNQCESVHKLVQSMDLVDVTDRLLASALTGGGDDDRSVFGRCPTLVLLALQRMIPANYSQWSPSVRAAIDDGIARATSCRQSPVATRVLLPCAVKARYVVQESILASLAAFLSNDDTEESLSPIARINRALAIMTALCSADPSYFPHCFDILTTVKSIFEVHLDRLSPAEIVIDDNRLCLTTFLRFICVGVDDSSIALSTSQSQWEFILCLIDTLIRSEPFSNSGNYRSTPIVGNHDHLINGYWLLKIVSSATVSLASVKNSSVIDEWDNFFSQPIFTAILDQFSLIAGSPCGSIVYSESFVFFAEALSDAVSLCPVNALLVHNLPGLVHINDPLDLPREFLVAFNFLLDSLSSSSLSVQLAAYNCLQNLTEMLSELLLEQVNVSERSESLDISFNINLPHKLVEYIVAVDNFDQLNLDIVENQIVLVRCFLSWNIVLQLFATAQPKLRAEISAFLSQNDRCFDRFLNFCFTFMPKNPIVNKKHLSFIDDANSSCCNLIAEEPHIFSQCIEKRSKFIIYHLSAYIFRRSMQVLPNLCRGWWQSLYANSQQIVDGYVRQFLTKELFKIEFKLLKEIADKQFDEKIEIKAVPMIGEVTVKYNVSCDQSLEQLIRLPNNYPIGNISAEYKKEMTVKIPHWKSWIGQMTMTLENQVLHRLVYCCWYRWTILLG